jgi:uncharacterized protein YkvS
MFDKELIEKKISQIVEYMDELNPIVNDIPESEVIKIISSIIQRRGCSSL